VPVKVTFSTALGERVDFSYSLRGCRTSEYLGGGGLQWGPGNVAGAQKMKALSILVVEDDAVLGLLVAETLKQMGHRVCAIETTQADAVTAAVRYEPDLVIVDAQLRFGNGITAIEDMLRTGPIPHVFVTGDTAGVKALRPDAVVVQKPFREADLVRAIQCALDAVAVPITTTE
jgi:CheY-like chemotaxis protein